MSGQRVQLAADEFQGSLMELRKDDRFLNFVSLLEGPQAFTITGITLAELPGRAGKQKQVPCAALAVGGKECQRKWLITAKVCQMELCRRSGSNKPASWIGLEITLYADPEVTFGPKKVGGIRIQ